METYFIGLSKCPRDFFLSKESGKGISPIFKVLSYLLKASLSFKMTVMER
jgi:hypothetical protein